MSSESRKILVADDSQDNRANIERILEDLDVEVVAVENGEKALEKLKEMEPVLFILDSDMPDMDGYQVLNQMMTDENIRHMLENFVNENGANFKISINTFFLDTDII